MMVKKAKLDFFLKPDTSLFFLGIGGVSMSSLAFCAKEAGCRVAGYDAAITDTTRALEAAGIRVYNAFDPSCYEGVDYIVYTGAIHGEDPVLAYPRSLGIPEIPRARFLGMLMKEKKNPVGIAGTHGKSTTTGMISSVFLAQEDRDPTVMAGATLPLLHSTWKSGAGEDFLFEACEYQDSFLNFFPHLAVILNVEHDHADYFPTLEDVIRSFVRYADLAAGGYAVINFDNQGARSVAERTCAPVFFFSEREKKDLWCENLKEEKGFYSFDICTPRGLYTSVSLRVPGRHNVSNALAAASAAYLSGIEPQAVKAGLERFCGVKRRFEYRGLCGNMRVFDDYAHHPDEIRATLLSAKAMGYPFIKVVFQSHTYTRTRAYWKDFLSSLSLADEVIFADIYPAREAPLEGITAQQLAKESSNGIYLGDFEAIASHLAKSQKEGLLLIMGAGDVIRLTDQILTKRADE